ncbi:hypothetical protein FRACYDRAFT_241106 [Fragilariopsis cylindrus CCMP1102]|uniref:Uncharacterized protein n=1 Tax=Fragilariopsis cylindrus CCMP1102 TaxID=635003 RepID=A0A1E7F8U5_9STRA|nr:hypothetical protein FRACYDRAFT_241106 [Fragilariopsis cylindrus CCMP1102]|eukprot:OEU14559.1 hypothetical protein FRACYDRAFT_241106 [Fragilariopsis cylindrus CCMP1102]
MVSVTRSLPILSRDLTPLKRKAKDAFSKLNEDTENWLYEDGFDVTKKWYGPLPGLSLSLLLTRHGIVVEDERGVPISVRILVPWAPGEEKGWVNESDLILLPSTEVEVVISFVALGGGPISRCHIGSPL